MRKCMAWHIDGHTCTILASEEHNSAERNKPNYSGTPYTRLP